MKINISQVNSLLILSVLSFNVLSSIAQYYPGGIPTEPSYPAPVPVSSPLTNYNPDVAQPKATPPCDVDSCLDVYDKCYDCDKEKATVYRNECNGTVKLYCCGECIERE